MAKKFQISNFKFQIFFCLFAYVAIWIFLPHAFADESATLAVLPRVSDYQLQLTSNDGTSTFPKDQTLTYTITYGASQSAAFASTTTITAYFNNDTINGTHVLDYVTGSATNAYNNTPPIVDLSARTITWTITSLPPGVMDQEVTFQLRTNDNYTGTNSVNFSVKAIMSTQFVTLPEQDIYQTLNPNLTPTPQPPSSTTPTPTPIQSEPTPTQPPEPTLTVSDVFFNSVSNSSSEISVVTSVPTKLSVFYGTNPTNLTTSFATGDYSSFTEALLTNLSSNTVYYFRIDAIDANGNKVISEIFTFKTTATSPQTINTPATTVISSNGNILSILANMLGQFTGGQVVLPNLAPCDVTYTLPSFKKVKYIEVVVRNKYVLGINTYANAQEANVVRIAMLEKQPGVYYAQLPPIFISGDYDVYVRVTETSGNIYEQKISEIRISLPLKILEKGSNKPLGDARIYFYFYNTQTHQFDPISSGFGQFNNPQFSDKNGSVNTTLPKGTYMIQVSALFHGAVTKEFVIDTGKDYPTMYLEKRPNDILGVISYFGSTLSDFTQGVAYYLGLISSQTRYFNLFAVVVVILAVFLTFFLFLLKTRMSLKTLPHTFYHHLHHTLLPFTNAILLGRVVSPNGTLLSSVDVYALNLDQKVLFHTITNKLGVFTYKYQNDATQLRFMCEGFEQSNISITDDMNTKFVLSERTISPVKRPSFLTLVGEFFGFFFEGLLAISFLLEFIFMIRFGFFPTLPFLFLSIVNVLLWIFYLRENNYFDA